MSSGSGDRPTQHPQARACSNVEAIARAITPDRPPPEVVFTTAPIIAHFHYATDTLQLSQNLVPLATEGTDDPKLRALVAHELGHRTDGRPSISNLSLPLVATGPLGLLLTLAAFVLGHVAAAVSIGAVTAVAVFALRVHAHWVAEYRCDDFAAERTDTQSVITLLDAMAADARDRSSPRTVRLRLAQLFAWVTHPPYRCRVRRRRARTSRHG